MDWHSKIPKNNHLINLIKFQQINRIWIRSYLLFYFDFRLINRWWIFVFANSRWWVSILLIRFRFISSMKMNWNRVFAVVVNLHWLVSFKGRLKYAFLKAFRPNTPIHNQKDTIKIYSLFLLFYQHSIA